MRYAIRPMAPEDVAQVSAIEREAFPETWPPTSFRRDMKNHLMRHLVASDTQAPPVEVDEGASRAPGPHTLPLVGRLFPQPPPLLRQTDRIIGYVSLWFMMDDAHITSIAVTSSHRGLGVGELLLIGSVEMALLQGSKMVTLEVRVSNTVAHNLYKKYGFAIVGRRRGYYSDNNEDAFVMSTEEITSEPYRELFDRLRWEHSVRRGVSSRYLV